MKKIVMYAFVLCLLATSAFAMPQMKNSPDGFRGLKWGDPATKIQGRKIVEDSGYLKIFVDPKAKLSLGNVPLESINYVFCKNRLMGVDLRFSNSHFQDMKQILYTQYGQPISEKPHIDRFGWLDDNAMVNLEKYLDGSSVKISSIYEINLMDKVQKENAQSAGNDF